MNADNLPYYLRALPSCLLKKLPRHTENSSISTKYVAFEYKSLIISLSYNLMVIKADNINVTIVYEIITKSYSCLINKTIYFYNPCFDESNTAGDLGLFLLQAHEGFEGLIEVLSKLNDTFSKGAKLKYISYG